MVILIINFTFSGLVFDKSTRKKGEGGEEVKDEIIYQALK